MGLFPQLCTTSQLELNGKVENFLSKIKASFIRPKKEMKYVIYIYIRYLSCLARLICPHTFLVEIPIILVKGEMIIIAYHFLVN